MKHSKSYNFPSVLKGNWTLQAKSFHCPERFGDARGATKSREPQGVFASLSNDPIGISWVQKSGHRQLSDKKEREMHYCVGHTHTLTRTLESSSEFDNEKRIRTTDVDASEHRWFVGRVSIKLITVAVHGPTMLYKYVIFICVVGTINSTSPPKVISRHKSFPFHLASSSKNFTNYVGLLGPLRVIYST